MLGRYVVDLPWWATVLLALLALDAAFAGVAYLLELEFPRWYLGVLPGFLMLLSLFALLWRSPIPLWYKALGAATGGTLFAGVFVIRKLGKLGRRGPLQPQDAGRRRTWVRWAAVGMIAAALVAALYFALNYLGFL